MCKFLTKLFKRKKRKDTEEVKNAPVYSLVYEHKHDFYNHWDVVTEGSANWRKNAGLIPTFNGDAIQFPVVIDESGKVRVAALKTKDYYDEGAFECLARFKGGKGSWPAIWMTNKYDGNKEEYYEIDLSEYYENRKETTSSYHCYESMVLNKRSSYITTSCPINPNDWTKFRCEWDKDSIRVYINGMVVLTIVNTGDSNIFPVKEERRKFNVILSMQYATNKRLQAYDTTELPLWMEVKDIKIYKLINPTT